MLFVFSHLHRGPRTLKLRFGAACERFDAYSMRHSVTESSYINSLAYHPIRSTIKTLPATLPEPSFEEPGPSATPLEPRFGVTDAVLQPAFDFRHGGGG